ncbi:unnamed protein product [Sphagnum tenellum]
MKFSDNFAVSYLFDQSLVSPHDPYWESLSCASDEVRRDLPSQLHLARISNSRFKDSDPFLYRQMRPMKRTLYLSIRTFEENATNSRSKKAKVFMRNLVGKEHSVLSGEIQSLMERLKAFSHALKQLELRSPMKLTRLSEERLLDYLRKTFNPKTYYERSFASVNPKTSLSKQAIYCGSHLSFEGITREGVATRTLSLKNAPQFAYPGAMAYFLKLPFPYRISVNLSFPSKKSVQLRFGLKETLLKNAPSAKARQQKADVLALQDQIVQGDQVIQLTFSIHLESDDKDELDGMTQDALAEFRGSLDCDAIVEKEIGLGLWLNALPLNYHPISDYATRRAIRILKSDLIHFLPVFGPFRGWPTNPSTPAQSLFFAREGGLIPFNIKAFGNSHNGVFVGDPGSAKSSVLMQMILGEMRRDPMPLVFVIDSKSSWGMISHFLRSEFTTFEQGKPLPFSPFKGEMDEDKIKFLVLFFISAIQLVSPNFQIDSEHRTCLSKALRNAHQAQLKMNSMEYVDHKLVSIPSSIEMNLTIDHVIGELGALTSDPEFERYQEPIDQLTSKLKPFYGDGIYASFFRSTTETGPSHEETDLFVYDLDALSNDPVLRTLVTMSVIDGIRRRIRSSRARERKGWIVIEELGMLGKNPAAADFVVEAVETFRKLGFFLLGISPRVSNFFDTPAGRAMWDAADHYFFLKMGSDSADFIAQHSSLLDEAALEIIRSLRTEAPQYAQCFYLHKSRAISGAFKVVSSPKELWLAPTHAPDADQANKALLAHPKSPEKAIQLLMEKFPRGTSDATLLSKIQEVKIQGVSK